MRHLVVIVDDDSLDLEYLQEELVDAGYLVVAFTSSAEAIDYLMDHARGTVDAVITDLRMPGRRSGDHIYELAKRLGVPALVRTQHGTSRAAEQVSKKDVQPVLDWLQEALI